MSRQRLRDLGTAAGVALLVAVAMVGWSTRGRGPAGAGGLDPGTPAPAFALPDVRGGDPVALASLRGRPVVLSFWATWCGPCVRELPELERLHAASGGAFTLLTLTSEPAPVVLRFLRSRGLTLPVLHDADGAAAAAYRVRRLPTTVVLGADGAVAHAFTGRTTARELGGLLAALPAAAGPRE